MFEGSSQEKAARSRATIPSEVSVGTTVPCLAVKQVDSLTRVDETAL